jgi:hypothetical protein
VLEEAHDWGTVTKDDAEIVLTHPDLPRVNAPEMPQGYLSPFFIVPCFTESSHRLVAAASSVSRLSKVGIQFLCSH